MMPISNLMDRMGIYVQNYTCYNSVRPFGIVSIIGGVDNEDGEPYLYMIEPSGSYWGIMVLPLVRSTNCQIRIRKIEL